jgi:histidinol-phosphate aminotransferase
MFEPRDAIREMVGYHSPQVEVPVRLNTNESPFPPPEKWVESLQEIARNVSWNRYPDRGSTQLREVIANRHGLDRENVFVANGSNEVLQTILLTYGGHGRKVATFEPTYQMYGQIARVTGAEVITGERHDDFTLDDREMKRVMDAHEIAVTFLANPNNPTGVIEPQTHLEALLGLTGGIVVVDEAYGEFANWSAIDMVNESERVIVTRTFSKTLSLAGLRVGYAIGPRWMIEKLNIAVLPYHMDAFKQAATVAALSYVDEMQQRVEAITAQRGRLEQKLKTLGMTVWPSGANFVLFRPDGELAPTLWSQLLDRGILVRDCGSWPRLERCLRVTVGTEAENSLFLDALEDIVG